MKKFFYFLAMFLIVAGILLSQPRTEKLGEEKSNLKKKEALVKKKKKSKKFRKSKTKTRKKVRKPKVRVKRSGINGEIVFTGEYINDEEDNIYGYSIPSSIFRVSGSKGKRLSYEFGIKERVYGSGEFEVEPEVLAFNFKLNKRVNIRFGRSRIPLSRFSLIDDFHMGSPIKFGYFSMVDDFYELPSSYILGNENYDEGIIFWGMDNPYKNIYFKYYVGFFDGEGYMVDNNLKAGRIVSRFQFTINRKDNNFYEKGFYGGKGYFSIGYGLSYDRSNGFYNEETKECNPTIGHVIDFIFENGFSSFVLDISGGYLIFSDGNELYNYGYSGFFLKMETLIRSLRLKPYLSYERFDYEGGGKNYWSVVSGGIGYRYNQFFSIFGGYSYYRRNTGEMVIEKTRVFVKSFFRF